MATEDWETTCLIYGDDEISKDSKLKEDGRLERGSIELRISTSGPVFSRRINTSDQPDTWRFWISTEELNVCVTLLCSGEQDEYERVELGLKSDCWWHDSLKHNWLEWMTTRATEMIQQDQVSYSVCSFIQNEALDFFPTLYKQDGRHLVEFPPEDRNNHYPESSIVATLGINEATLGSEEPNSIRYKRHDANGRIVNDEKQELTQEEATKIFPLLVLWREWLPVNCKICLQQVDASEATSITCGCMYCRECIAHYVTHKARELSPTTSQMTNPFTCPSCRRGMLIIGCVKQFLPPSDMERVRQWLKDVKNPPCYSLPSCLRKKCSGTIRRVAVDSEVVFCDKCHGSWCEMCLQRTSTDDEHDKCNIGGCVEFCKRYMQANPETQALCEERFPFIKVYARSRLDDNALDEWIQSNGQVCPGCKTGVERTEGCFHIACVCGTHFCYLCGEQIYAPFYGTHHCWERQESWLE